MSSSGLARRYAMTERAVEPVAKKQKTYDQDTISANLKAVFPNWTPEDPSFMLKHGFAEPGGTKRRPSHSSSSSTPATTEPARPGRRNAGHTIAEICEGPYLDFLDRHGKRTEHFPHDMMRQLEATRKNVSSSSTTTPTGSPNRSSSSGAAETARRRSGAFVVVHTQRAPYDKTDLSYRLQGVYKTPEGANVKTMELFQKQYRKFMLDDYPESPGSSAIPFVHSREGGGEGRAGGGGGGGNNRKENECEASWWIDAQGCLSLRATNWGSGDGRVFVAKQELHD
ncbi:hypothetical protein F4778DRAFT_442830 [Xylariomycetidae sp. FL2044]|nr:hypothetical protein F4778DRAFT_442830 [Xylariomycetidae sp. FL2044]